MIVRKLMDPLECKLSLNPLSTRKSSSPTCMMLKYDERKRLPVKVGSLNKNNKNTALVKNYNALVIFKRVALNTMLQKEWSFNKSISPLEDITGYLPQAQHCVFIQQVFTRRFMERVWIISYFIKDSLLFLHNNEVNKRKYIPEV